jgi:DNA-binding XRE family transcriptional regulator
MEKAKKQKLEAAGYTVGSAEEFLGLTSEESALIDVKLALASLVREMRAEHDVTQVVLAKRLGSSQSRVAKLERGDPSVSIELLLRAAFALGANRKTIGKAIAARA